MGDVPEVEWALGAGRLSGTLHKDRSLTITYPDGTIQTTGPPGTERAA
ncbi:MAG: hypothetical protein JWL72_3346 [Ilumatobacteraceae bacterium]|nr:hypothetical protein [Ilumatobacteraceae bacterium]